MSKSHAEMAYKQLAKKYRKVLGPGAVLAIGGWRRGTVSERDMRAAVAAAAEAYDRLTKNTWRYQPAPPSLPSELENAETPALKSANG